MSLERLEVSGLRNLRKVSLKSCRRINILSGPNGSGKTSLLEAIYLLATGRSFRSSRLAPLISHEMVACTVYGELAAGCYHQSLALMKSREGAQEFRVDRRPVSSAVELASVLPVQIVNSDSFGLIDGGPKTRRQFMDWGVFHVKPAFIEHWRRAQRCLKQRNSLLRQRLKGGRGRITALDLEVWDRELSLCAEAIDSLRAEYTANILPIFDGILLHLAEGFPRLSLEYQRGWAEGSLMAALVDGLERDARLGTTAVGPHRANLDIRVEGLPAAEVLSRGQQKLVVSALRLAQCKYLAEQTGVRCVYLIDDLPAELDKHHRKRFCELLDEMGCQVFITGVDADDIEYVWRDQGDVSRFHVEQGQILYR